MEKRGSARLSVAHNKRVSHTFFNKTTPGGTGFKERDISNNRIRNNVQHHFTNEGTRCTRGSSVLPQFSIDNVPSAQSRRHSSSYFQLEGIEQLCVHRTFSSYKCVPGPGVPSTKRLALQGRSFSGVLPPAYSAQPQTLSTPCVQRRADANDLSPVRHKHGAESVCLFDELGCANSKRARLTNTRLLGRFFDSPPGQNNSPGPCSNVSGSAELPGMASQFRKVSYHPSKEPCLPRDPLGPVAQQKELTCGQSSKTFPQGIRDVSCRQGVSKGIAVSDGTAEFRGICNPERQATLSRASRISQFFTERTRQKGFLLAKTSPKRIKMVASQLSPLLSDSLATADTFCNNGRFRFGMGSSDRRPLDLRSVGRGRTTPTLQYEGDAGSFESSRGTRSPVFPIHRPISKRQPHGGSLLEKRRWNQVFGSHGSDKQDICVTSEIPDRPDSVSHSGNLQRSRRPSVQASYATGMASAATEHGSHIPEIWDPNSRSLRLATSSRSCQLRFIRSQGSSSTVPQCVLPNVELSVGVGIPSALPHPQSADAFKLGDRSVSNNSTPMGSGILESRPKDTSDGSPVHHSQSPAMLSGHCNRSTSPQSERYDPRGVEVWGWSRDLTDWNETQLGLLKSSWRTSTRKTYEAAWNRWLQWCKQHDVNPLQPSGSVLARYLADLHLIHKLAYNTILVHKSAVATLCSSSYSGQLSSHALVKHILKSIALTNPTIRKPPIWDINILVSFMKTSNVNENNVFAVCRHTSTLLLLCSGRRVHDLTLLAVDSEHLIESSNNVILWPKFGSKTDSSDHRQSGWRLLSNPDEKNLDPVFWIRQTVRLLSDRRRLGKCTNLFTTIRGEAREASRTLIAGWIKTLLTEAGINSTPGSLRSAVASKNWANRLPLDEILSRGNWKSANTFARFYRREIAPAPVTSDLPRLFNPVD